jgi:hypothetical protein
MLDVRTTAASSGGQTTDTHLVVGGLRPSGNLAYVLGPRTMDTFSVTTTRSDGGGSGDGAVSPWFLALFVFSLFRRRW